MVATGILAPYAPMLVQFVAFIKDLVLGQRTQGRLRPHAVSRPLKMRTMFGTAAANKSGLGAVQLQFGEER